MPPPTLFDDDGEPRDDRDRDADAPPADTAEPNYLVRRAIVVGVIVAVIAVGAIVVGSLISDSDADTTSGAASIEWDRVVLIDPRSGRITITDDAGAEVAEIATDVRSPSDVDVVGPTALITSDAGTAVVDLASEEVTPLEISADSIVTPAGSTLTMVAPATTGRRGLLVHGPSGDVIDTDELAAVAGADFEFDDSRTDTSGRHVLVTDSGNFQSVLFSFERDEPSFFPGLALAIDGDVVVTTQNVGNEATVSVFDHAGELTTSGRTPSVRAGMISDDTVQLVTVDGEVITMDADGETESSDTLDIGTIESGYVMPTGDRLVVNGSAGTAVIDETGSVVASASDAVVISDGSTRRVSTCIPLVRATSSDRDELVLIDARDGTTIVEAEAPTDRVAASADGCTVAIASETGYDVISADGVTGVADDELVSLSPDGTDTIVERDRRLLLTSIADDTDPIDLAPRGPTVFFTET